MLVTVDNAEGLVENVSVLLSNFSEAEQSQNNFGLLLGIYESLEQFVQEGDAFNVSSNVITTQVMSSFECPWCC